MGLVFRRRQRSLPEECVHEKGPEESNWHILDDLNGELEEYFDRMDVGNLSEYEDIVFDKYRNLV